MKTIALIVAAGSSTRFGGEIPKQFQNVKGKPLLSRTIEKFQEAESISNIVVVVGEEYLLYTSEKVIDPYDFNKVVKIVPGGESRQESVLKGLEALPISTNFVAIHDAARMLIAIEDINRVVDEAIKERAAILAVKTKDTVKRVAGDYIISTLDRSSLYQAQTPQVFQYDLILKAHREYAQSGVDETVTDDSSLIEKKGFKVKIVEPNSLNFKITTPQDLELAGSLLENLKDE